MHSRTLAALSFVVSISTAVGCASTPAATSDVAASTKPSSTTGIAKGQSLAELKAGNERFVNNKAIAHSWQTERVAKTGEFGQTPSVGVLSCADSRVPVEVVFDQGVGELFVVRVAGNSESATAAGTFEYGVAALGVHTILVLGHTKCGAVDAAVAGKPLPGNMGSFTDVITPALKGKKFDNLTQAAEANVRWQSEQLLKRSEILRQSYEKGDLTMLRGIYDVETGVVRFID